MANKLYEENNIQAIADAIRYKNGYSVTYTVGQMANAIRSIPSGINPSGTKTVTSPGTYDVRYYDYCDVDMAYAVKTQSGTTLYSGTYSDCINYMQSHGGLSQLVWFAGLIFCVTD